MSVGRDWHTATLLAGGRVLIAGGLTDADANHPLSSAELYDPTTGKFSLTGSMAIPRFQHTATLLQDGRVLVVGGYDSDDFTGTGDAPGPSGSIAAATPALPDPRRVGELYDPATGTFSRTGSMSVDRYGDTATLLKDGRVLIVGGESLKSVDIASAELFDPKTNLFTATGSLSTSRTGHTATLLPDGRVLIAGGYSGTGLSLASAELYDPTTGKFSLTGSMSVVRTNHTATLLRDGRVLIAGGFDVNGNPGNAYSSAELYDPVTGTFGPTGSMWVTRTGHTATLLEDGQVLLTGSATAGSGGTGKAQIMAELYDPTTGTFSPTAGMNDAYDTATGLANGAVLLTGGSFADSSGTTCLATADLYQP
jgi:WD40 repeat protein